LFNLRLTSTVQAAPLANALKGELPSVELIAAAATKTTPAQIVLIGLGVTVAEIGPRDAHDARQKERGRNQPRDPAKHFQLPVLRYAWFLDLLDLALGCARRFIVGVPILVSIKLVCDRVPAMSHVSELLTR
jgi:hypothetical protein